MKQITFLGDRLSLEGVQSDHTKVNAARKMANPTDRKDIQQVFGYGQLFGKVCTKSVS